MPFTYLDPWDIFDTVTTVSLEDYDPIYGISRSLYPNWHVANTDRSSNIAKLIINLSKEFGDLNNESTRLIARQLLLDDCIGSLRYLWILPRVFESAGHPKVSINFGLGDEDEEIEFSFPHTADLYGKPSFVLTPDSILLTNLAYKEIGVYSSNNQFTIDSETSGIISDLDLWFQGVSSGSWQRVPIKNSFSGNVVTLPTSGRVTLRYGSLERYAAISGSTVYIDNIYGNKITATPITIYEENSIDSFGLLSECVRLDGENNDAYRDRLYRYFALPPSNNNYGTSLAISLRLGLVKSTSWDGQSELVLDAGDSLNIRSFSIPELLQFVPVKDRLLPLVSGSTDIYMSMYSDWYHSYQVFVDNIPVNDITRDGNLVTLTSPTTGIVTANYGLVTYSVDYHSGGNIRSIKPGGLPLKHSYEVYYVEDVNLLNLGQKSVADSLVVDPAGLPTKWLRDIRVRIQNVSKIFPGRSDWNNANWLSESENLSYSMVSIPFDN